MKITRKKIGTIITVLILLMISIVYIVPILMMVLGSFKTQGEALRMDLTLPAQLQFENYQHVIETGGILRGYTNNLIITVSAVAIIIIFGSMTGIIISRRGDRKGRGLYYYFVFGLDSAVFCENGIIDGCGVISEELYVLAMPVFHPVT